MYIWWCFGDQKIGCILDTHLAVKHLEGSILTTTSYFTDKTNVVEVLSGSRQTLYWFILNTPTIHYLHIAIKLSYGFADIIRMHYQNPYWL
jgi:hypothetical protein